MVSLEQICSRSRDLVHLIRTRNLTAAATGVFEFREALAKFSGTRVATQFLKEKEWAELLKLTAQIHNHLESAASIYKIDAGAREMLLQQVTDMHVQLNKLAAIAGEKAGEKNADSK